MINDNDDSLKDIALVSDSLLESLEKLDLHRETTSQSKQAPEPPDKPLFRNIRTETSGLWQQIVGWHYMQGWLIVIFVCYVLWGIRGDGWGLALSTLFVAAVSFFLLPFIDKKRRPLKAFFRGSSRPRENPSLNMIAYFFVFSYCLTTIISLISSSSGGRFHLNYIVLPLALAMPSAIVYWNSSNSSWIKKSAGSICCPAVVFASIVLFFVGAEGSGVMQNVMGLSYYRDGSFKQSLESYTKAISVNPRTPVYLVNRGWTHYYLKNKSESVIDAQKALKIDPKNSGALKLLKAIRKSKSKPV